LPCPSREKAVSALAKGEISAGKKTDSTDSEAVTEVASDENGGRRKVPQGKGLFYRLLKNSFLSPMP